MNVEVTKLPESKVALKVELTVDEVEGAFNRTYKQLVQRVSVPGFRRGKAPRPIVERLVGAEFFVHEATEDAIQWGYRKALDETHLVPIDQPEIDTGNGHHVEAGAPFQFEATVSVRPEIPLPDYHTLRVAREQQPVTDADVQQVIDEVRREHATLEPTTRPAMAGDTVVMSLHATVEGQEVFNQENATFVLRGADSDEDVELPGLSRHLDGATSGLIVETAIDLPASYHRQEFAGKPMALRILVKEVKTPVLPELDDEFVREVSPLATVDALRGALRDNLEQERRYEADRRLIQQAISEVVDRTFVDIPPILIEEEIERMIEDLRVLLADANASIDAYVEAMGLTLDQLEEQMREEATRRVKTSLVLTALAEAEGIEVSNRDVDAALEEVLRGARTTERERRKMRTSTAVRSGLRARLRRQRAMHRLVEIVTDGDSVSDEVSLVLADEGTVAEEDADEIVTEDGNG